MEKESRFLIHYGYSHTQEILKNGGVEEKVRQWEEILGTRLIAELDKDGWLMIRPIRNIYTILDND